MALAPLTQFRSNWLVDPSTGSYTASIPSPTGIPADPELTAHGVDQAKELGAHLMTVEPSIEAVYSSPYYRCLQTITPFVALKQERLNRLAGQDVGANDAEAVTIRPEHGLSEWYGAAPFEHPTPASSNVLKSMFPHLDTTYQSAVFPARNGETIAQLHDRIAAAVQAIIEQCDAEGKRAVVLCSHAASIIALGRVLTGVMPDSVDVEDFRAFTCGLSVYRRRSHSSSAQTSGIQGPDPDTSSWKNGRGVGGGWICELNSDCSFLSGGEERGWRFSGDESFSTPENSSQAADAGVALGVVVEGKVKPDKVSSSPRAAGHYRL
ncbi:phosphoglycerate mutase [Colletotrichum navitas]|uniref:Phosphoglycerate mutase n=1 Tax=Colletotrichum navitas TaxID=681940 RepID=A0AAD8VAV8_9PEZI|nr:phosphoglycerate mutase [Colletotrichum navitas]KAK1598518.1 phosphoglycerate mutase [Colletotrichum navitas]